MRWAMTLDMAAMIAETKVADTMDWIAMMPFTFILALRVRTGLKS